MPPNQTTTFFRYWFPVVLYCLFIFIQSSFPASEKIPAFVLSDKLLHLVAYALLGALFLRGFFHSSYQHRHRFIIWASIFLTAFYGATDEFHQSFVPFRSAEVADFLFDCLGAFIGAWSYYKLVLRYPAFGRI